jgi:hypothetical protein
MSDLHEATIAKDIRGLKSRNSGAGWQKADAYNKVYAVEGKSSLHALFQVDSGLLRAAVREAHTRGLIGVVSLAWIEGDPGYPKGLTITRYCYMIQVPTGPADEEYRRSLLVNLGRPIEPKTYRFRTGDPRTGEWWRLITPNLARKKLGTQSARLN